MLDEPASAALDEQLCFALYGASMAVGRLYKPLLDALGITYPQYLALSALWEEDSRGIGAIAARLALEPSTITPLIKRLEAAGLVRRERSQTDERQVFVHLTEEGHRLRERSRCLGASLAAASAMAPDRLARLSAEVRELRDALARQLAERRESALPEA